PAAPSSPLQYLRFASAIGENTEVWSTQNPGYEPNERLCSSRDEITRFHIDAIHACSQPEDSVILMGYSGGGWLACDIAAELEHNARPAAGLVLVDTYFPHASEVEAQGRVNFLRG